MIERPVPAARELLIRVEALSINPVDWKLRSGAFDARFPLAMPCQLGADVAGKVRQAGAEAGDFKKDDRVFAMLGLTGAYAEFVCVDAALLARTPEVIYSTQAASLPLAALTAWQGLFEHGTLEAGESLLVHGAAGGVGIFAVQLAKWKGAQVVATASENNAAFVSELGADMVFDYRAAAEQAPTGLDMAIDLVGDNPSRLLSTLRSGGTLIQVSPGRNDDVREKASALGIRFGGFQVAPNGAQLQMIADLVEGGHLTTHVSDVVPFADIAKAHAMSQQGHTRGKIVIKFS